MNDSRLRRSRRESFGLRLQRGENLIQQIRQLLQQPAEPAAGAARVVEQVCDRAEQVAEQGPRPGFRRDVEVHLVQVDHQPEQVEVQWTECQAEDLARQTNDRGGRPGRTLPAPYTGRVAALRNGPIVGR